MKQALAIGAATLAAATPFAAIDHHARTRIARQQKQINRLNYLVSKLDSELANVAQCTSTVYPITFRPDGTIALSFTTKDDRAYIPSGNPNGCPDTPEGP